MLLESILSVGLALPGLWILQLARVRVHNNVERLSLSYILSLSMMFSLLYLGGIMNAFNVASFLVLAIIVVSSIHLFVLFAMKVLRSPHPFNTSFFLHISAERLVVVISAIGLLSIYTMFLSSRALLDSDVVQYYLPIAREIVRGNGFTYTTGYDYNVLLKPIGASVIYAWTYVINGSTLSEAFRLTPLIPIIMLIVLNYAIATSATKSQTVGIISTAVFLVLPLHDRFLLYNAFYPDIFYYPLIFATTYFLLEYFQSKRSSLLFWTGVGLGAAGLLKAQTIYIFIAFMLVFLVLELRSFKKFSAALCILTPFYILAPNILADSIQRKSFLLSIPSFTGTQLGLFLFLSTLSGVCYYVTIRRNVSRTKIDKPMITGLVKRITLLLLPFALLSSLWYVNNLLRYGTLIWTSSINLPNYDWALGVLKSMETTQPTAGWWHYLVYFMFMFVDPAVMGYTMLIPLLIGLLFVLRGRLENFKVLLLFGIISASIILSNVVISLPSPTSGYNPRDILPLAPLLTTLSALGIVSATSNFSNKGDAKSTFVSLLLTAYFGFLGYIHSVSVWDTSSYYVTAIGVLMSAFGNTVGLNLRQTSFQLAYGDRAIFVGENILRIVSFSLVVGIPVLALMIRRHYKLFTRGYNMMIKLGPRLKKAVPKLPSSLRSSRQWVFVKSVFVVSLMLSIIIIPRLEMLIVQGGAQEIKENQLKRNYRNIYELFASPSELEGHILTFKASMGLPYYLPSVKIIDLIYPSNLAYLKDALATIDSKTIVTTLGKQGIRYLLLTPEYLEELDKMLNSSIGRIAMNPILANQIGFFGSWTLYALGPFEVLAQETLLLDEENWSIHRAPEEASFHFNASREHVYLQITPVDNENMLDVMERGLSEYNVFNFDYLTIHLRGSDNALFSLRLYFSDGTNWDFPYWGEVPTSGLLAFSLENFKTKVLRGDLHILLKTTNNSTAYITIETINLVKLSN